MKLRLTQSEFDELYRFFNVKLVPAKPATLEMALAHVLVMQVHQRLYELNYRRRHQYTISLKPEQSIAWFMYWHNHPFAEADLYAFSIINPVTTAIHQRMVSSYPLVTIKN